MSTTRLTFLYPHLFRSVRISEPASQSVRARSRTAQQQCRARRFSTAEGRGQRFVQRHGKAVEPFLMDGEAIDSMKVFTSVEEGKNVAKSKEVEEKTHDMERKAAAEAEEDEAEAAEPESSPAAPLSEETQAAAILPGDPETGAVDKDKEGGKQEDLRPREQAAQNTANPLAPLETVLQMPPPESQEEKDASKPPHLHTPPYVHHFDTYTLVQQVGKGGFTTEQSITAMKAVRGLLALNLDVAKAGLVSKYDVENETYLFRAACSELKTEIQNQRKANDEAMRRERTLLQHEVDILNQKLTQELLTLKDDLKGMFDDRKMAVRMEQRTMESMIQEINYKITVALNSDSKSEVEGLRWVLTRRSVLGILFMAMMVLVSLKFASIKTHEDEVRRKKEENKRPEERIEELPSQGAAEILAAN
ncbi:hypothetical protein D0Z07_5397 [Hyphodiscus hymeniophilus]|uniref:MOZ protein represents a chromatin-associated acetyltransferase n=1 Tax=Hyphodiscus hymeniophilus TaxID=353542 RepID=A0A9P7AWZ4_9HELO|nr:hypothetical protein D0Z07_5397 [Hyphodiscus hymeniophilus]